MAVSLSPIGGVAAQFFDNNGNPLAGGKLYSYEAGTTTPQTTYTSIAGTVANTNPIILNAAGRVPGEVWLTTGSSYKFVLNDSVGNLIGTWDNIYGYSSGSVAYAATETQTATADQSVFVLTEMQYSVGTNTLAVYVDGVNQVVNNAYVESGPNTVTFVSGLHVGALVKFVNITSASVDASTVTYEQGGTGAVATTVQAKLRESVSVTDFGAVGDGVTDDTAAIQAALDSGASTVTVPDGTYIFTSLLVPSNTTFKGAGGTLKLKDNTCTNPATSYYLIYNSGNTNVTYDNLIIDGNKANNTSFLVADGITATGTKTIVRNCKITNPPDSGIMFSGCIDGACINNYIEGATDIGIYVNGTGAYQNSLVSGNTAKNCAVTGIALKRQTVGVVVDSNTIMDCPNAISHEDFGDGAGGHPSDVTITNNQTYNTTNGAFVLNRLTNSIVANNKMSGVNQYGISMAGAVNSVVSGNTIVGGGSETTSHVAIYSVVRVDPMTSALTIPDNLTITGNVVSEYLGKGIYVQNGTNISITGNNIKVGNEGLRLDATVSGVLIQQNVIDGTPDTALYSGATYITKNNVLGGVLDDGHITISAGQPLPNSGSSTLTAQYIGQEALHLAANTWWKAYGTGLTQWTQIG